MAKIKKEKPQASKKSLDKKTYVCLVLDKSGSMALCRQQAIEGFNAQMDVIKENTKKGGDTKISVVTFNGIVEINQDAVEADKVEKLTPESYNPWGSTAMLDAVWDAIVSLEKYDDKGEQTAFLVVTISDGEENASQHTQSRTLAEKIQQLENTKRWTFGYVGANQDLSKINEYLNIPLQNSLVFTANMAGYTTMADTATYSLGNYMSLRSAGTTNTAHYFVQPETITASKK